MLEILLTGAGYREDHFSKLAAAGFKTTHMERDITEKHLKRIISQYDAYVLGGDEILTRDKLLLADNLRVISFVGTGYTSFVDEITAKERNIVISNTPQVMAPAVAEHILGLLIGMQRKLFQQNWEVKNNCIRSCYTNELSALRMGIIGMGAIGERVARILRQGFDSEVTYYSRTRKTELEEKLGIISVSLDQLFSKSNAILFTIPTNYETEYFFNESLLSKLPENTIIINAAGARLIEPVALMKYLQNNRIASVAFDGYYIEPLPNTKDDIYGFLSLPDSRFVLTPHTAAKTVQSWNRMVDMAIDNVIKFFSV